MKHIVHKPRKMALCRACGGEGVVYSNTADFSVTCAQCAGSGRVWVSAEMVVDVEPFVVSKVK